MSDKAPGRPPRPRAKARPGGAAEVRGLYDLTAFLAAEEAFDAGLDELAQLGAQTVEAACRCSIMLLSEGEAEQPLLRLWAASARLPDAAWRERPGVGVAIAGEVLRTRALLVVADIRESAFASLARGHTDCGPSFMCLPITVGRAVFGVLNVAARAGAAPFAEPDVARTQLVASLVGKSVQVHRLQTLLRSRVAQLTLARQEAEVATSLTDGAMPPSRLAKVLAKTFYKDLAAAGFEPGQIIEAATEIIGQISGDIARHKTRMAREGRQDKI
jgi:GAF domain-containing protein